MLLTVKVTLGYRNRNGMTFSFASVQCRKVMPIAVKASICRVNVAGNSKKNGPTRARCDKRLSNSFYFLASPMAWPTSAALRYS